jgi:hypothetical protein
VPGERREAVGKKRQKKTRERREVPVFECGKGSVPKMSLQVKELLETLQCCCFPHFAYESVDEGLVRVCLRTP